MLYGRGSSTEGAKGWVSFTSELSPLTVLYNPYPCNASTSLHLCPGKEHRLGAVVYPPAAKTPVHVPVLGAWEGLEKNTEAKNKDRDKDPVSFLQYSFGEFCFNSSFTE
jgi:hypothetical protein